MIPKIIHCFWAEGPKTELAARCEASWRRLAPEFTIREWSLADLTDVPPFCAEAIRARKWAMVSDWVRMWALEREGGVYLDFDVELLRPLSEAPEGEWVAGEWTVQDEVWLNPGGGLALEKGSAVASAMLARYADLAFDPNRAMMPWINRNLAECAPSLRVLPPEMMSPIGIDGRDHRTSRTIAVHHYAMAGASPAQRVVRWLNWHGFGGLIGCVVRLKRVFAPRVLLFLLLLAPGVGLSAEKRLSLYDIVPYSAGHESRAAEDIRRTHETAGLETFLYCVTLDPRGVPAFACVEAAVASYRKLRAELKGSPVRLGFLLQAILGHWPRVDREIEPWQRSIDETGAPRRFCILDPRYREYIRRTAAALAAEGPCFILCDDDVRAFSPRLECFCPLHTAEFNRRSGLALSSEAYRAAVQSAAETSVVARVATELRDEIPMTVARLVREGIDSVDPSIPSGACTPGAETLLAAPRARLLAGRGRPSTLRLPNGKYSEFSRDDLAFNALLTQAYLAYYRPTIDSILDESDTFPHTLYAKSGRTFVSKLALGIFNGIRGAKLWFVGMHKGTERVPARYDRELGRHNRQLEALASALEGSTPLGVRIPAFLDKPTLHAGEPNFFADLTWLQFLVAPYGIPYYADFSRAPGSPVMLCGARTVDRLCDAELRELFEGRVFADGPAALRLAARGFAADLGCRPVSDATAFNGERIRSTGLMPTIAKTPGFPVLTDVDARAVVYSDLGFSVQADASGSFDPVGAGAIHLPRKGGFGTFVAAFDPASRHQNQNPRRKAWLVGALRTLDPSFPVVCENVEPNLTFARRGSDGFVYVLTLNGGYDDLEEVVYSTAYPVSRVETLGEDGVWRAAELRGEGLRWSISGPVPCMAYRIVRFKSVEEKKDR